jgi:AmpD protein
MSEADWLPGARRVPSPNADERPPPPEISLLVIHNISLPPGRFGGPYIEQLFSNSLDAGEYPYFVQIAGLRVSAHLLIRRDGSVLQFVPFGMRAWHAGVSNFRGRERCNDFSIGIELEGADHIPYDDAQYLRLDQTCRWLIGQYPAIRPDRITGHSDIAPGRKTDPGPAFDWQRLQRMLAA